MKYVVLLCAVQTLIVSQGEATNLTSATAVFGGVTTCSQSGAAAASCSQTQGADTVGSSAQSNITVTAGLLDVIVNTMHSAGAFNSTPAGSASASFSQMLIVTGGTGSGILVANFSGFDDPAGTGPLPALPVLSIELGSTVTNYNVPGGLPASFSFSTPFTYGVPLVFDASISANAQTPLLMANAAASADIEGKVNFTGFTLTGANGQTIPGQVVFTPEPASFALVGMSLLLAAARLLAKSRDA